MARRLDAVTVNDLIHVARIARQMSKASRWAVSSSLRDIADILEVDPDEHDEQQAYSAANDARERALRRRR
jgi:hypothetical protein